MKTILRVNGCEAVCDTLGGELISYKRGGREYVWCGDADYWTGHAPVLFPFVGALKDNVVEIDGKSCFLDKKHGFARKSEFVLTRSSDTFVEYVLRESESTLAVYPYPFKLSVVHEINDAGFKTTYTVKNPTADKDIQFAIGGHAGFYLGNIEDYHLEFPEEEDCPLYYTDEKSLMNDALVQGGIKGKTMALKYTDYDVDALVAKDLKSRSAAIVANDGSFRLGFDFQGFDVLGIWTPPKKKAPFLCLEPWNGCPAYVNETGRLADKPYIKTLKPGQSYSVGYTVTL